MAKKKLIQNLKNMPLYGTAMEKLTVAPNQLDENEVSDAQIYCNNLDTMPVRPYRRVRALLLAIAIPAVQITACGAKQPSAE